MFAPRNSSPILHPVYSTDEVAAYQVCMNAFFQCLWSVFFCYWLAGVDRKTAIFWFAFCFPSMRTAAVAIFTNLSPVHLFNVQNLHKFWIYFPLNWVIFYRPWSSKCDSFWVWMKHMFKSHTHSACWPAIDGIFIFMVLCGRFNSFH